MTACIYVIPKFDPAAGEDKGLMCIVYAIINFDLSMKLARLDKVNESVILSN